MTAASDAGQFADAELAAFVTGPGSGLGPLEVATLRVGVARRAAARPAGPALHAVDDLVVAGRPARLYLPSPGPLPLVVYLHGGGWTIGDLASHDRVCRRLADGSGAAVLALEYRLAPEHPWPAAVDDTVDALRWAAGRPAVHGWTPTAVAVAGDSAGGTLAALACLRLRDTDRASLPAVQVLLYADTDLTGAHPSMVEKATGWGLDAETTRFFAGQWVPDQALWADPAVSPLHAPDLRGLPPAVVVTAEHDVLRDEGEAYAARLRAAGVPVTLRREPGMIHNFMLLDLVSRACAAAADRVAADLRTHLPAA